MIGWLVEHGLTFPSTQYRLYGRRFLQVKSMKYEVCGRASVCSPSPDRCRIRFLLQCRLPFHSVLSLGGTVEEVFPPQLLVSLVRELLS